MNLMHDNPIFPIPPSYNRDGSLDFIRIEEYINYLHRNSVKFIMTTAGTSQFNLLSRQEIDRFNLLVIDKCIDIEMNAIIGVPPADTRSSVEMVRMLSGYMKPDRHAIMPIYPDRYYGDRHIVGYFHYIAECSSVPVLFHAMPMRDGVAGSYSYSSELISSISSHDNIIGMKEESPTIDVAYNVLRDIDCNENFCVILAGGSIKRYIALRDISASRCTFLSGVGSIFPCVDIEAKKSRDACIRNVQIEKILFKISSRYGWHAVMRCYLAEMGLIKGFQRRPFPECTAELKSVIQEADKEIRSMIKC